MEPQSEQPSSRPWYKKKRYIIPIAVASIFAVSALTGNNQNSAVPSAQVQGTNIQTIAPVVTPSTTQVTRPTPQPTQAQLDTGLSNDNYYTNSKGSTVHSPAYSNSIPPGASARCGNGSYSFSQSRRGTCSHHGGVSQWY
jgi:hypothetical protein